MAGTLREDFARIIALARDRLTDVRVDQEIDPTRAMHLKYGKDSASHLFPPPPTITDARSI